MSYMNWQRRSSSMRHGRRSSQDRAKQPGSHTSRFVDRGSRIPLPRSSSQTAGISKDAPGFKRSKSTLGDFSTPQQQLMSASKITPQSNYLMTPKFSSAKKSVHQKDQRNLHDKEYQQTAFNMVLMYFQNNDRENLKATELRSMTIKMFIEMVNHLVARLGIYNKVELFQFTSANYERDLPHLMRLLEYPGTISKGWLQTVNVPQCLPHVIGLLHWLVTLVETTSQFDMESRLRKDFERDSSKLLAVKYLEGCLTAHNADERDYTDICQEVVELAEHIHGVTQDVFIQLEAENEKLNEKLVDPHLKEEQDALDELEQRLSVAQSQSLKALKEIELKIDSIAEIKASVPKKEKMIALLKSDAAQARQEGERLKQQVETQVMSVAEFTEFQKKCEYLLKEISYIEKEGEDNQKIAARYDQDISTKRDMILQNTSIFNRYVIQLEQKVPELIGLRVRVKSDDGAEEVERLVQALRELKARLAADCEELETLRKEEHDRIEIMKQRLNDVALLESSVRDRVNSKKTEIEQLKAEIVKKENNLKFEVEELEKRQLVYQQKLKECDNLRERAVTMEKRSELYEKALNMVKEKERVKWGKLEETAKYVKAEIGSLTHLISSQEQGIRGMIDEIVADLHK